MYATGLAWTVVDISYVAVVVLTYGFKLRQSLFTARTYKVASHLEEFGLFTLEFTRGFPVGALYSSSCLEASRRLQNRAECYIAVSLRVSEHFELAMKLFENDEEPRVLYFCGCTNIHQTRQMASETAKL